MCFLERKKKKWAMFIYMAADNDLSKYGLQDIQELCKVGSSDQIHIALEIDTEGDFGSMRYEISPPDWDKKSYPIVIETLPEQDSGDPKTFRAFLEWAFSRYEAEHYVVVVWGHGSGFKSKYKDVASDYHNHSALDIAEIENIFSNLFKTPKFVGTKDKLELLAFDACLMGLLEVAYHFRNIARYMVSSQHKVPHGGWFYDQVIPHIHNGIDIIDLLRIIVDEYIHNHRENEKEDINQAAISTEHTVAAMNALHDLGNTLTEKIKNDRVFRGNVLRIRLASQFFKNNFYDYIDACHFAQLLINGLNHETEKEVVTKAEKFITALKACIIFHDKGKGLENATGLSIWFPTSKDTYEKNFVSYQHLTEMNADQSGWPNFLQAFHFGHELVPIQ